MKAKHIFKILILLVLLAACTQPSHAVIYLTDTGWDDGTGNDPGVGTWVQGTLTGTLTQDVTEPIHIAGDGLTLNGGGYILTEELPSAQGYGVYIADQNDVTVTNINITGVPFGILIENTNLGPDDPKRNTIENCTIYDTTDSAIKLSIAHANDIINNDIHDNFVGINLFSSGKENTFGTGFDFGNTITGNTLTNNAGGIYLDGSRYNSIGGNTITGHSTSANGIYLKENSNNNILSDNTSSNNNFGIRLRNSNDNTMTDNTISNNRNYGIWIDPSNNNIFTFNDISNNEHGLYFENSSFNEVYNNNFINNTTYHAYVTGGSSNVFNLADPAVGGNYWSGFSGPGAYTFDVGQQDNAPWPEEDGWVVDNPPEITCPGDTTIEAMEPDGVPIDDDRIQTFLDGASATDDIDPPEDIVITNDAPALFPPGDTVVTFTATDTSGNSSTCMSTVTVVEAAESYLKIIPRIINREGRLSKILAVIRFPAGTTAEDIDIGQNLILYPGDSPDGVVATNQRIITWYRCGILRVSVFACFNKDDVTAPIPEDGSVEMMVIGRFTDGQYFYGFDNVNIISWSWGWW